MRTPNIYISVDDGREQWIVNGALRLLGKLLKTFRENEKGAYGKASRDQSSECQNTGETK